jgi:hypothetical protein
LRTGADAAEGKLALFGKSGELAAHGSNPVGLVEGIGEQRHS